MVGSALCSCNVPGMVAGGSIMVGGEGAMLTSLICVESAQRLKKEKEEQKKNCLSRV